MVGVIKKLEELAIGLYKSRKESNSLEKEVSDYISQIKRELEKAGISADKDGKIIYDGSAVYVSLSITPSYGVPLEKALKYADLKTLEKSGTISISKGKFEELLKSKGIQIKGEAYLIAEGKSERLDVKLKG